MIDKIKKFFSVDVNDIDVQDIEEAFGDKSSIYQNELNDNNTNNLNFNSINNTDDKLKDIDNTQDNVLKEMDIVQEVDLVQEVDNIKQTANDVADVIQNNVVQESELEQTPRRSFDFEKEIENAYQGNQSDKTDESLSKKNNEETKIKNSKDPHDIISKEEYVLKDIISPMHGIIRKENKVIKKEEGPKTSQIIKLREQLKTKEIGNVVEEPYQEILEFPFFDTKEVDELNNLPKTNKKDTLSETSKFTLIEDSTGEMRLVIDEEE